MKPKPYRANISRFLALCARNYAHIQRWLPQSRNAGQQWLWQGVFGSLSVTLLENTPYTQVVEIKRYTGGADRAVANPASVQDPLLLVRVYHDAQLAEVLTSRQICDLNPVYDYPNMHMYQRDEKYQVNAFLEDLLKIGHQANLVCQP
ncbi:DUF1249 domain-containing protein [Shewanella sp. NIFS-20-20]|uniref:DUF1249 domain-containing protein n=1 Tax=Shewanella sp. NIFS-20-20 TaxID=2853806 RepID=UPI003528F97F